MVTDLRSTWLRAHSLLVYSDIFEDAVGQGWLAVVRSLLTPEPDPVTCLQHYGQWFRALAHQNRTWEEWLITAILESDNPWTRSAQHQPPDQLPPALVQAAAQDLALLQTIAPWNPARLCSGVQAMVPGSQPPLPWDRDPQPLPPAGERLRPSDNWSAHLGDLADHYRRQGVGQWGRFWAFRWAGNPQNPAQWQGVAHPDPVQLEDLVGYGEAKAQLVQNTEFLLAGHPALNVLLYGSRGTGKSSLVKALLSQYGSQGLRLLEVRPEGLRYLPQMVEPLRSLPQTFIVFVDDLSFEEDDEAFKALKVVLEGNVVARPANVVVYATSNRRHLVRESFSDRPRPQDADEIHSWDTVQEKLSFSDRFGLTLTFEPPDQDSYLAMVRHRAERAGLTLAPALLEFRAKQWATRHNGRSGRTAQQLVDWLQAEQAQGLDPVPPMA